jgi:lipopolysaccharide export system permease protein
MILWRYILRAHVGPFVFSNAIIIFLFLLQFLMKRAGDLVGKGLSTWVILELISLNLAWMLVLSVPMAVLVATLMAFGKLSADNEITIMRASGMSLYRMMAPVVLATAGVTAGLIWFNNDVLPDANVRLQTLMTDIVRIKPTLSLQAGVFTSDQDLPSYRILVRRTFEKTNDLEGVTIYDLSDPERAVVVTAERGTVSFSSDYSRIIMDLHDGEIHEVDNKTFHDYRRLYFHRHRVSIPASGFGFQRSDASSTRRDDRTMSAQMMQVIVDSIDLQREQKIVDAGDRMIGHLRGYFAGTMRLYSAAPSRVIHQLPPGVTPAQQAAADSAAADSLSRLPLDTLGAASRALTDARQLQAQSMAEHSGIDFDAKQTDRFLVEIYKKYSIPAACLVFVLIGAPLGMMARRGGFGVGAGLSLGFFLFYWACLIGGEKLADRGELSPFLGMWVANIILGIMGAILVWRTAKEARVIDWSSLTRFVPKSLRGEESTRDRINPHEA